jgi:hypothetical protein
MGRKYRSISLSKCELHACLNQPGSRRADDLAEPGTTDVAVNGLRSKELSVIENIEGFEPELEGFRLGQTQVLEKRHIEVLHSGAMEITPRGGTRSTQRILAEQSGIEIRLPVSGIAIQIERTSRDIWFIYAVVVDPVWLCAQQRVVAVVDERHRKARAEARDPGEFPSLCPVVCGMEKTFQGCRKVTCREL